MEKIKEIVCDFRNLYKALRVSKSGIIWKDSVAKYVFNSLKTCHSLIKLFETEKYDLLPYTEHTIYGPKVRQIECTRFRDRIFQRSLCDNYLYEEFTKNFVETNCSSQRGKGTDFAREALKRILREHHRHYGTDGYCLKCDIKDFYGSTPHFIAKRTVEEYIEDLWARKEIFRIIDSFKTIKETGKGLGLGSQITQLVQLAILDKMDHKILEDFKIPMVRYNDDFLLICESKEKLHLAKDWIEKYLSERGLAFSKKKTQIFKLIQPIKFLGFSFLLHDTGKITLKLLPNKISNEKRKLRKQVALVKEGVLTREKVNFCYETWRSHAKKSDSRGQILKMDNYYESLWDSQ